MFFYRLMFAPQTPDGNLKDRSGQRVYLMGDAREILRELATEERWKDTKVAVASRCDEPRYEERSTEYPRSTTAV